MKTETDYQKVIEAREEMLRAEMELDLAHAALRERLTGRETDAYYAALLRS